MHEQFVGDIGGSVERAIRWFTELFILDGFGGVLFLFIGLVSLVILAFTIAWRVRAGRELHRAIAAVELAGGASENERQVAFVVQFDAISERLSGLDRIGRCWREFAETLDRPEPGAPEGTPGYGTVVRNERRPQDYLTLTNADMTAPVLRSLPGVLIGVGLFLTFVGLIAALGTAADTLAEGGEQTDMVDALRELLGAAGAKFYASATALMFSILLGLVQRASLRRLSGRMHALNDALEERLQFDPMASTMRAQSKLARDQYDELRKLSQDIGMAVGERVRDAVTSSNRELVESLNAVVGKLDALGEKTGAGVSATVAAKMDEALSGTLTQMDATLREVGGSLGRLPDQIGGSMRALNEASGEMVRGLGEGVEASARAASEALTGTMTQAGEAVANDLRGIAEPLSESVSALRESSSALGREMAAFAERAEQLRAAIAEGAGRHEALAASLTGAAGTHERVANDNRDLMRRMTELAERLQQAGDGVSDGTETIVTTIAEARERSDALREQERAARERLDAVLARSHEEMERHVARYDGLDEAFGRAFNGFQEAIASQQRDLARHVAEIDHRFANAVGALDARIEELADAVEGMGRSGASMRGSMTEAAE